MVDLQVEYWFQICARKEIYEFDELYLVIHIRWDFVYIFTFFL